ncbi:hypothetical protein [Streptomyces sp. KLOTTS4A1]
MRRQTIRKPIPRPSLRRERQRAEETQRKVGPRPEVRKDILKTWWPQA